MLGIINEENMKAKDSFSKVPIIVGIIITVLMVFIFGTKLIGSIIDNGPEQIKVITIALIHWYDDPTGFFLFYLIGYSIVWWKPLWGSLIIIVVSILITVINIDNLGMLIFSLPTFSVGFLYLVRWNDTRKNINDA